ncbi:3-oxoacyl-ACP synthase [Acholeplasma laidlawii]|jgi:3-oxoacyl-[acyl-carrier-protein] synthase-3|uniref:3-oxoacyl-[acyl-carrier-protein] synthase III n=1 Tax=Acholeplasma laidlawii (strain PG-8A) TaxID=441768 RepID=A9NFJ3_ACHLI|nr:3-oxoacyl-ACP synthase [Acholeplasma laidlawii]ABX81123.1 3-oxoacyl-[acyl-carrier-protein] synthase III [Acholeplasma laidlawii PG-8A]RED20216.1 3-oxoacyl-[acyl-carrier-protein] synthase-3 [Acholeplasma laidlawii]SQH56726.1 3-oxoacyl-[acyl-carrier-protein] synthase 3 [Acholeplasma laidlawii]
MKDHVGIVGTGIYLPKERMTAKEISEKTNGVWTEEAVIEKLGIKTKVVPSSSLSDGTQEMGALAALDALKNTGIDPLDIDIILSVSEEWKEYPLTTSALYVQDRIGAINAWGIDVQNRCCTTVSALKMAKDMLLADPEVNVVMVVGGYRNGDFVDYSDKNMSMMFNLGAGGGAIILKKNYGKNLLLGSHMISDGSLSRTAGVEIGGIINPITKENMDEAKHSLRLLDPVKMKNRLNDVSMPNWYKCIDESLRKSNLERKDIDFLNILHIKRSGHLSMLNDLGLTEDQTIYLEDYGHIGQIDQILTLHLALEQGKVKDGTVMAMIAAGIGYVWAANIIQWGPMKS